MKDLRDVQSPLVVEDTAIFHRESNGAKHPAPAKRRFGVTARALLAIAVTLAAVLCGRAQASDTTAPVVTITTPAPDLSGGITGTAADETGGSGLSSFTTLRLWRYSGSTFQFWNGTAWTTTVANLAATVPVAPSTSWSVTTALPSGTQLPPSQYGLQVAIKDIAGNISPTNAIYFKAGNDETAPSSVIHTPAAGSNVTSISTISSTSTNVASPSGHDTSEIRFLSTALRKRVGTTSTYLCWDFVNHAWVASWGLQYFLTGPTDSNWSVSANLPSGADLPLGEYYVNQYCTDYSNNISNTSNYFSVVAPPAPTGLTATARGLAADLAWTAPVYPGGTTGSITSYRVERQTSGGSWTTLTTTTGTTYTNTGLTSGTAYGYRVIALDGLNESAASNTATVTPVTDVTAPVVEITTPGPESRIGTFSGISGTATDEAGGTGVASFVQLYLRHYSGSQTLFWTGTAWTAYPTSIAGSIPVAPATAWSVTAVTPSGADMPPGWYQVEARIKDVAGNLSVTKVNNFTVGTDATAPTITFDAPGNGATSTRLPAISLTTANVASPAGQDTTGLWRSRVFLYRSVINNPLPATLWWDFTAQAWITGTAPVYYDYPSTSSDETVSLTSNVPTGSNLALGIYTVAADINDNSHNGAAGNWTFTIVAPPAPTALTATARGLAVDLAWTAPVYPGGTTGSITSYRVERQTSGGSWSTLTTTTGTTYTNTGLTSGTAYGYRVIALDGLNESAASSTATVTPVTDVTPPVVTITSPTNNSHVADLSGGISGTATDEAGGSGVGSFYALSLRRNSGAAWIYWNGTAWSTTPFNLAAAVPVAPSTTWTVTTPMPSGADLPHVQYTVIAWIKDAAGNFSVSKANLFTVGTDTTAPTSVINSPANGANVTSISSISTTTTNVASPAGQDTSDIYSLSTALVRNLPGPAYMYWNFANHTWVSQGNALLYYPTGPTDTTWSVNSGFPTGADLPLGDYSVSQNCTDYSGNVSHTGTTFHVVAPPAPTSLTATPAAGAVNLAWTAPAYPAGTTGAITSYRIERQAGAGAWSTLATATGTTYTDSTVTAGTTYTYRAYALDGTNESAASNTATATSAALTVSLASTVVEGATLTATVTRNTPTAAALTVNLASSNTAAATVPATVTIAAGETSADFTLTAVDDHVTRATQNVTITASATGFVSGTDTVSVTDNDVASVTVTPVTGLTTTEAPGTGHTATFTVCLATQPTADVTIALSSSDTGEGTVAPATLTFTSGNWDETQLVTVTGVPDGIVDGDQPYTVVTAATSTDTSYDGVDVPDVAVTNLDMDTAGLTLALGPTVAEGDTLTGIVSRNTPTAADLVVSLASDDTTEATVPATVTILAGHADATFTLTGVDDGITDGAHDAVISATATAHAAATDTVSVTDISTGAVDALVRKQGDPAFLGNGVVNTSATGQTAAQNAAGNVLKSYDVRVFNRQTAAHTLTLKASASAGGGAWTITYYANDNEDTTDITAAITSAEGWSTADPIDPGASTTIRIDVKPAITVEADTVKTVTLTATTAGDAEASDTIAAVTTKTGAAPPVLTATGGEAKVTLAWNNVTGATSYKLFRGPSATGAWTEIAEPLAATYIDTEVVNGTTYYYYVTATTVAEDSDPSNVANATPHGVKADVSIRNGSETDSAFAGNDTYNTTGSDQTKSQSLWANAKATYVIRVQNDGESADTFKVTGPAGSDGWSIHYFDATTDGTDITTPVTGSGWVTPSLESGALTTIRAEVTPAGTVPTDEVRDVLVTATSQSDSRKADAAKASTTRTRELLGLEYIIYGDGSDAPADEAGNPLVPEGVVVGVKAVKAHPSVAWPTLDVAPYIQPSWNQDGHQDFGGTIWAGYGNASGPAGDLKTITATAGDSVSTGIRVIPNYRIVVIATPTVPNDGTLHVVANIQNWDGLIEAGASVKFTAYYDDGSVAGTFSGSGLGTSDAGGNVASTWSPGAQVSHIHFVAQVTTATGSVLATSPQTVGYQATLNNMPATSAGPSTPATPTVTTSEVTDTSATVSWTANTDVDFDEYRIYRSTTAGPELGELIYTVIFPNMTSYRDSDLSPSTTYYYKVVSADLSGSADAGIATATTSAAPTPEPTPAAPAAVTLTAGTPTHTSVPLSWTASTNTNFNSYEMHRSTTANFTPSDDNRVGLEEETSTTASTDRGLLASTLYYYKVLVVDSYGQSTPSNEIAATTAASPAAATTPTAVTLSIATSAHPGSVDLSWTVSADPNFSRYEIHRSPTAAFTATPSNLVATYALANTSTTTDAGLDPAGTYYYQVVLVNDSDQKAVSNEVSLALSGVAPPAAIELSAGTVTAASASLSWNQSADSNFSHYELHRSLVANFTPSTRTRIQSVFASSTVQTTDTFVDSGLTYYYKLAVFNVFGQETLSNQISMTTIGTPASGVMSAVTLSAGATTGSTVQLSWTPCSDPNFMEYDLYRSTTPGTATSGANYVKSLWSTGSTQTLDSGLSGNTTYYYVIVVRNRTMSGSATSNEVNGTTGNP